MGAVSPVAGVLTMRMTIRTQITGTNPLDLLKADAAIDGAGIGVGVFDGEIAGYGAVNELGSETIPARPFLRSAFDANAQAYAEQMAAGLRRVLAGTSSLQAELTRIGIRASSDAKRRLTELRDPPNALTTIAKKGSSNPLIDTGALRNAITFEVLSDRGEEG